MLEKQPIENEEISHFFKQIRRETIISKYTSKSKTEKFYKMMNSFYQIGLSKIQLLSLDKDVRNTQHTKLLYRKELEKFVDDCLTLSDHQNIKKLIDNGYQLTDKQNNILNAQVEPLMEKDSKRNLDDLVENGFFYTPGMIANVITNTNFYIYCSEILLINAQLRYEKNKIFKDREVSKIENIEKDLKNKLSYSNHKEKGYDKLVHKVNDFLKDESLKLEVFKEWLKIVSKLNNDSPYFNLEYKVVKPYDLFNIDLIPKLSPENLIDLKSILSEFKANNMDKKKDDLYLIDRIIIGLDSRIGALGNKKNNQEIDQLIAKSKIVYLDNIMSKVKPKKEIMVSADHDMKSLPKDAQEILQKIENTYNKLYKNKDVIEIEALMDIDRFIEKRIPEMIVTYFNCDTTTDNNDAMTAKKLLVESLKNINTYFENINEKINQSNLKVLSANYKYTQNFVK